MTGREVKAIKEYCLNPAMWDKVEISLGNRGGFSIENKYTRKSHPLERLFNAGKINSNQKQAGLKLGYLAYLSGIYAPSGGLNMERLDGGKKLSMSERQAIAYSDYFECMHEIARQIDSATQQAIMRVSVYEEPLTKLEMLPWRGRVKKICEGLDVAHEFFNA